MIVTGLLIGGLLGFVMQRGRFCVTGMIRDVFTQKTWRGFTALLIVIAIHAVGLTALTSLGVISPDIPKFAPAAVIIGGFLFGLGIVLAGGCASGTWYRSGEGLVGSWIALGGYAASAAAMNAGALSWLEESLSRHTVEATTIYTSLGVSAWLLVIPFTALATILAVHYRRRELASPRAAELSSEKTGLAHLLTEKPWHPYAAAILVGLIGVIAWPLSAASGRNGGLSITTPSSDVVRFIATGDTSRINWATLLVIGILIGAYFAAKASGEFRLRVPSPNQAVRSVVGGVLMGIGAVWAGGCTVGNGMVQTGLFSYQGWVALVAITAGVWVAAAVWLKPSSIRLEERETTNSGAPQASQPLFNAPVLQRSALAGEQEDHAPRQIGERTYVLDTLGAVCPFPLVEAKQAIATLEPGDNLVIDFDCTQATDAIPRWAAQDGHSVTNFERTSDAGWTITVRKDGQRVRDTHEEAVPVPAGS